MPTLVQSCRIGADYAALLSRQAKRRHLEVSTLSSLYLKEKAPEEEFPGIGFRDSAGGREAYVLGHRVAVWEVASFNRRRKPSPRRRRTSAGQRRWCGVRWPMPGRFPKKSRNSGQLRLTPAGLGHAGVILFHRSMPVVAYGKQARLLVNLWPVAKDWDWADRIEYLPRP